MDIFRCASISCFQVVGKLVTRTFSDLQSRVYTLHSLFRNSPFSDYKAIPAWGKVILRKASQTKTVLHIINRDFEPPPALPFTLEQNSFMNIEQ